MFNFIKKHYLIFSFIILFLIAFFSLSFGSVFINLFSSDAYSGVFKQLFELRIYRTITAFTVGGALSVAGLSYQAVLRNPLAEPFILGISGGASIGAAIAISLGLTAAYYLALPACAFAGAIIVLIIVLSLARGAGIEYSTNVMLSGVIAGTVCTSILMFIISNVGGRKLNSITWWMLGNLQPRDLKLLLIVFSIVIISIIILFFFAREINVISMGEEVAYYLGINPRLIIYLTLGIASLITALVVGLAGIIGFVGLIVPHTLRRLFGANHRKLFPLALIYGGLFLIICDTVSRTVLTPQIIPVGVITALIGGPFFMWVLNRKRGI